jgi:hypothetical protein
LGRFSGNWIFSRLCTFPSRSAGKFVLGGGRFYGVTALFFLTKYVYNFYESSFKNM